MEKERNNTLKVEVWLREIRLSRQPEKQSKGNCAQFISLDDNRSFSTFKNCNRRNQGSKIVTYQSTASESHLFSDNFEKKKNEYFVTRSRMDRGPTFRRFDKDGVINRQESNLGNVGGRRVL